jgi:hypothetical protein
MAREHHMPTRFFSNTSFSPEQITTLVAAFERACNELGLVDRDDPLNEVVAKAVIYAAKFGTSSAAEIEQRALMIFRAAEQRTA